MTGSEPARPEAPLSAGGEASVAPAGAPRRFIGAGIAVLIVMAAEVALLATVFDGSLTASVYFPLHVGLSATVAVVGWSIAGHGSDAGCFPLQLAVATAMAGPFGTL